MLFLAQTPTAPEAKTQAEAILLWVVGGLVLAIVGMALFIVKLFKRLEDKEAKYGEILKQKDAVMIKCIQDNNEKILNFTNEHKVLFEDVKGALRENTAAYREFRSGRPSGP